MKNPRTETSAEDQKLRRGKVTSIYSSLVETTSDRGDKGMVLGRPQDMGSAEKVKRGYYKSLKKPTVVKSSAFGLKKSAT